MSSEAKNVGVSNLLFYINSSHLRDAVARQADARCVQVGSSMSLFRNAQFEISIAKPSGLPPPNGPEIAFAGRSNAGKSSAINTLANHVRLAFVSKTPGRTQLINFFRLQNGAVLVDLPGYGYAEVPEAIVGAGTVRSVADAQAAKDAGAIIEPSDVADAVMYMLTRPRNGTIHDIVVLPTNLDA